jgi:hypothetical protein
MKKPGEFQAKRKARQRQAKIYNALNEACKLAMETGSAVVQIDNRKFYLSNKLKYSDNYYTYLAMIRLKKRGIVFAEVNENKEGEINALWPFLINIRGINSFIDKQTAAFVDKVEELNDVQTSTIGTVSAENC